MKLSDKILCEIASPLGADVPHFILGGTNRATGIGQYLKKINHFKAPTILLAKPNIKKKTSDIYKKIDKYARCFGKVKISKIAKLLNNNNFCGAAPFFQNILEMAYDNKKITFYIDKFGGMKGEKPDLLNGLWEHPEIVTSVIEKANIDDLNII